MKLPILILTVAASLFAQADVTLQRAIRKETLEGDLKGAIALYQKAVAEAKSDRPTAAKALVRMADCYTRLGDAEARKVYERVLREYADQNEAVATARAHLGGAGGPRSPRTRQLWSGSAVSFEGSVSPDGRWLTFANWETGDLGVRDLRAGTNRLLTNLGGWSKSGGQFAQDSVFSPDGKQIAYNWYLPKAANTRPRGGYEVRLMSADGSGVKTIAFQGVPGYAVPRAWSPDGKRLAIVDWDDKGLSSLHVLTLATGELKTLIEPRAKRLWGVSFSPDGEWIAFDSGAWEIDADIYAMPAKGGAPSPLVVHDGRDVAPLWSPDGKSILFTSDRTGAYRLYQLPVREGKPAGNIVPLRPDLGRAIYPIGFSKSGAFHYGALANGPDIYEADFDAETGKVGKPVMLSDSVPGRNAAGVYSPDGKSVAWLVDNMLAERAFTVMVRDLATGKERTYPSTVAVQSLAWSPDSRRLLFQTMSEEADTAELHTLDLADGAISNLTKLTPTRAGLSAIFSADGKEVYALYREWPKSEWQVIAIDVATHAVRSLLLVSGPRRFQSLILSPDGRDLAFIQRTPATVDVMVLPVTGGSARKVAEYQTQDDSPRSRMIAWTADGKYLLARQGLDNKPGGIEHPTTVLRIEVATGKMTPLDFEASWMQALSIHPSGRKLAYQGGMRAHEIWVAEDILPPAK